MSKKHSTTMSVPSAEIERMFRGYMRSQAIQRAISKVLGGTEPCLGLCFPPVYRTWMSYSAFQVA